MLLKVLRVTLSKSLAFILPWVYASLALHQFANIPMESYVKLTTGGKAEGSTAYFQKALPWSLQNHPVKLKTETLSETVPAMCVISIPPD